MPILQPPMRSKRVMPTSSAPNLVSPFESSYPPPAHDPIAAWELRRASWLAPRPPSAAKQAQVVRTEVFAERLRLLEEMLSLDSFPAEASNTGNGTEGGKQKQSVVDEELEPDGGGVIGRKKENGLAQKRKLPASAQEPKSVAAAPAPTREDLERAVDGILASFKAGRPLKESVPLSLLTKLLFRQWRLDGTIPPDYRPPHPQTGSNPTGAGSSDDIPPPLARPPPPPPPMFASQLYASAEASSSSIKWGEVDGRLERMDEEGAVGKELEAERPIALQGTKATNGGKALLTIGALNGSGWREEKDVASGSDIV